MKKLDKLILKSFIGPFLLTFVVVVFILLTQYMMKYFEEFVGKDLGFSVFAELIMYFSINMTPVALPLAVLLSSLMTFGNLGEHFELTAIKGAGISLLRALFPIFIFVVFLTIAAFFSNNYIVPKANLKAYSLLYDIKETKPSMSLKEGAFYNGIPNYSIKVDKKYPDGTLGDVIIYDHSAGMGNTKVIMAEKGRMYSIMNNRYLMLELFDGHSYSEVKSSRRTYGDNTINDFVRNSFDESKLVFSLASFGLKETKEELFASNRLMRNIPQLNADIDSMYEDLYNIKYTLYRDVNRFFTYHLKELEIPKKYLPEEKKPSPEEKRRDSIRERYSGGKTISKGKRSINQDNKTKSKVAKKQNNTSQNQSKEPVLEATIKSAALLVDIQDSAQKQFEADSIREQQMKADSIRQAKLDSLLSEDSVTKSILSQASNKARFVKNDLLMNTNKVRTLTREINAYIIEKHKKYAQAVACMVMFLIGAPLGAIIKRGGLGIPVIISIVFFIIYYVLTITGKKWGEEGLIDPVVGVWAANAILLPFGLVFLRQAKNDARIFESDFYKVLFDKFRRKLGEKTGRRRGE